MNNTQLSIFVLVFIIYALIAPPLIKDFISKLDKKKK